ncbi:2-methylcitrate dehydratase [Apiospora arundinis]
MAETVTNNLQDEAATNKYGANITTDLCRFIVDAKYEMLTAKHIEKLKDLIVDHIGIAAGAAAGADSSEPFLRAVQALNGDGTGGHSTVYTKGRTFLPQWAGFLNAAYSHSFDFDDTHATSILHPGATAIPAALVQAELNRSDGKSFLLAVAVGYEITTRLGRGLNYGGYTRGFHNTATAGVFGATAAICKLRGFTAAQVVDALGLALSRASGTMQYLANGAWNKRLHPGFAVHDAFLAATLAAAGVVGAAEPVEGDYGLLHAYSATSTAAGLTAGLGTEWIFAATAMKPFPSCRMTHSAIEVVANVAAARTSSDGEKQGIDSFTVELSPGCFPIVATEIPNKLQPQTVVDAQFSIYYQVAVAWLYGTGAGWAMYEKLGDAEVLGWCRKVKAMVANDVRDLQARVTFRFADGTTLTEGIVYPLGEDEHPFSREQVHAKFLGITLSCYSKERQRQILDTVERIDTISVDELLQIL